MASRSFFITSKAQADIDETLEYISTVLSNPFAAKALLVSIEKKINNILAFPLSYPSIDNLFVKKQNVRKVVIKSYILYYLYDEENDSVYILRLLYGKRNLDEIIKEL